MKALFYDTETTGLPNWSAPSEDPSQPRITQLCAELVDDDTGEVYAVLNTLIQPDGWTIPADLEALTGITTDKARAVGAPMAAVLPMFVHLWQRCDVRIAHNESFDMRMVRIELMRHPLYREPIDGLPMADHWKAGKALCTQVKSTPILKLPPTPKMIATGRNHHKSANLGEAYRHFTGKELEGAHNAAVDVAACKAVYFALKSLPLAA
jgi:DNA polymerase III subunit epsilon